MAICRVDVPTVLVLFSELSNQEILKIPWGSPEVQVSAQFLHVHFSVREASIVSILQIEFQCFRLDGVETIHGAGTIYGAH